MTPEAIDTIASSVPGAVQTTLLPPDWTGNLIDVPNDDPRAGEIEDTWLDGEVDAGEPSSARVIVQTDAQADAAINRDVVPELYGDLAVVTNRIAGVVGGGFPGAPGTGSSALPGAIRPPPGVLAFYLPWHEFPKPVWGIYLLVQGIDTLGREICSITRGHLTLAESRRVARMFLFHHEAYHNVTETFAARLEVSHRAACYRRGFRSVWKTGFGSGLHEEGLANAYAYKKVKELAFADAIPKGRVRTSKRLIAAAALRQIIRTSPPPYNTAMAVIAGSIQMDDAQYAFQEANHQACSFGLPLLTPKIWGAASHAMHPSLGRNRKFSYLIDPSHPSLRLAASVPHFDRRDVVQRLNVALGVTEVAGGRHPKVVTRAGESVPIPGHRELQRGTTRAILRQLGLAVSLSLFMSASDDELRAFGEAAKRRPRGQLEPV